MESSRQFRMRIRKTTRVAMILGCSAAICTTLWICLLSYRDYGVWSISIYSGSSPFDLRPVSEQPILSAANVTDVQAKIVADPFMVQAKNRIWYMFFEVYSDHGDIGLASSGDCITWQYEGIVLDEPFHLSYPCVFQYEDAYYMIPEAGSSHEVRLYKASEFPSKWTLHQILLDGDYADPTILRHRGIFYLFASQADDLTLHWARELTGPWVLHPASPIVKDNKRTSRQAGRLIEFNGRVVRFAQDGTESYGKQVIALEIVELSPSSFSEREMGHNPVLTASGWGWNKDGMHHIDSHRAATHWWACVDGRYNTKMFDISYGYRQSKDVVKHVVKRLIGLSDN